MQIVIWMQCFVLEKTHFENCNATKVTVSKHENKLSCFPAVRLGKKKLHWCERKSTFTLACEIQFLAAILGGFSLTYIYLSFLPRAWQLNLYTGYAVHDRTTSILLITSFVAVQATPRSIYQILKWPQLVDEPVMSGSL